MASQKPSPIGASPRSLSVPQDAKSNPSNGLVEQIRRMVGLPITYGLQDEVAVVLTEAADALALYQRGENRSANASLTPDAKSADTEAERAAVAAKAREWARIYPEESDGRNTFTLFAEWVEARK